MEADRRTWAGLGFQRDLLRRVGELVLQRERHEFLGSGRDGDVRKSREFDVIRRAAKRVAGGAFVFRAGVPTAHRCDAGAGGVVAVAGHVIANVSADLGIDLETGQLCSDAPELVHLDHRVDAEARSVVEGDGLVDAIDAGATEVAVVARGDGEGFRAEGHDGACREGRRAIHGEAEDGDVTEGGIMLFLDLERDEVEAVAAGIEPTVAAIVVDVAK